MTWYEDMFALVDKHQLDDVAKLFAEDIVLDLGGIGEPIAGKSAVVATLRERQAMFASESHSFVAVAEQGNVSMLETRATYTPHDGDAIVGRSVNVFERHDGLITALRIYAMRPSES